MSALPDVGAYWEQLGGVWGGHPTRQGSGYDPVHFEYPGWRSFVDFSTPDQRGLIDLAGQYKSARERALPYGIGEITAEFNPYGEAGQAVFELPFVGIELLGEAFGSLFR